VKQSAEAEVLNILNKNTDMLQYDLRHTYFFSNEIFATCTNFNNLSPDDLGKQLKQVPGVLEVAVKNFFTTGSTKNHL